jgi:hypothetical protein
MLLALYACTNNYHKTTCYQGPIAQKVEGEERASPQINIKSHLSCWEGLPEGSRHKWGGGEWKESSDKEVTIT